MKYPDKIYLMDCGDEIQWTGNPNYYKDIPEIKPIPYIRACLYSHTQAERDRYREELQTIMKQYEDDGMEGMEIRDKVIYNIAKQALKEGE